MGGSFVGGVRRADAGAIMMATWYAVGGLASALDGRDDEGRR